MAWPADCVVLLPPVRGNLAQESPLEERLLALGAPLRHLQKGHLSLSLADAHRAGFARAVVITQGEVALVDAAQRLVAGQAQAPSQSTDGAGSPVLTIAIRPVTSLWNLCGRLIAACGLWGCSGAWLEDPASPVRLVSIAPVLQDRRCRRAGEHVLLVRCAWQGLPIAVRRVPLLTAGEDRAGSLLWHAALAPLVAWLLLRRTWPWGRGPGDRQRLLQLLRAHLSPGRASVACAVGVAMAVAPTPGLQMALAVVIALRLRLNLGLTLAASNISFGPLLALWYAASTALGLRLLVHQSLAITFRQLHATLARAHSWHERMAPLLNACRPGCWARS